MGIKLISKSIDAENTYSKSGSLQGYFNISLSGTWVATVTVQRSFDKGQSWLDVSTFTVNTEEYGLEPEFDVYYRFGVKADDYVSGTVVGRLSQ